MDKPCIAARKSAKMELAAGTYYWCSCGLSRNQPFCDGSHQGTKFVPLPVKLTERQLVSFCLCKYSAKGHLCDGSHKSLPPPLNEANSHPA
ncbi:MAG: CDGSH iron-sulfur domain-containing protein [Deltaproteobacteria bacterium]|nr:CDGSH iron-sulfur domain-containing protein [Deltaproteobacteria bacterium]